ncbi:MAG: right-handed parallel beta-helix repeat-containing protein, partial [Flavobacteriales bacterium]|nr:right-handed parallel beta-helix repeat-containing protein [Flavobacteriales bacterium]
METHSTFSAVKSLHLVVVKSAFTALCILFSFSAFAQLSGTYTIGGTSPNYATFTAAVSALSSSGVSGPVTFNVRQGSYNEKLTIGAITGASATNKITFRADPANSAAVLLQYTNSSTSANYVVGFNSATYIYFKNIDFKANGTSYSTVVELSGLNHHIGFDSCKIESNNTVTGSSTYRCAIYELSGSSHRTSYFNLSNSQIIGGSYGVYVQGYSSGIFSQSNWNIEGNTIEDFYYAGIMLSNYIDTSVVKGNSVIQRSNSVSTSYGIYVYQCYQTNVLDNKVVMYAYGAYGLQASYCYGTSTNPVFIANNMVSVDNTLSSGTRYAFTSSYNTYANIVYNSIFQNGIGYALYAIYGSGCTYKNNAIVNLDNTSSSYGYYSLGTSVESNNLVWAPNCIVTNLTLSTSSVIANPSFQAKDNLHASGIHLNNSGTPITGITTDFDGQTRNTTTPDIGADEFTPPANDAGIAEIANSTICAGSTPIQVRLQNFGSNNLTSVTVNWSVKVNTGSYVGQTAYSFTGSVASGKDTVVTISNYSFTGSNTYDIKAWTTSPNSSTDGNNLNDTSSKTMTPSLGGIYTIGGTSPDYTTIQSALTDLKNKGVCAPVVFRIRAGSYIESVMVDSARGMSAINTVTLTKDPASTGVVLWGYNGIPLSFRYAHHFIIKNLNLVTLSASPVVYFYQENSHIKLISNNIKGYYTSTSSQSYAAIYNPNSSAYTNSYITIDSNRIVGGSSSIHMAGYSNYAPYRELGLRIRNNEIDSAGYYGIYLINQDSSEIIGNSLKEGNLYGTYYGLYTSNVSNFKIESNRFILANYSGTYGFYINSGGGSSGLHSSIINNYIQTNSGQYGAFLSQVGYFDFYYNTIKMSGTVNNSYALYLSYGYAFLKNNNISHLGEGYALYGINGSYLLLSDYNNIYSASTSKFSYYNGSYQSNFSAYKTASSKDANSVSVNPFFRLPNEPTPNHGSLNNAGDPISGITKDINGVTRHATTPDMGCVEFIPSTNDAGLTAIDSSSVCPGTTPVKVRLTNFGNNTLTQARIQWNVKTNSGSPIAQTAFTWTGSLPSYSDTLISIGNYTFVGSNSYSITAYTDQANSTTDPVHGNDTARIFSLTPKMTGTYTVGGTSPDYSTLSSAFMALNSNGVCGPVILNVRGGTYYGSMSVPSVPGSSTTNTITVQTDPSSSNRATFTNSYYPFSFFGASHYIFKKLTITVTGNSNVIYFNGSNEYITFDNDSLIGSTVNSTGTSYSVFYDLTGSSQIQKNLTIKNCQIIGGSYGIYLYGNGSSGTYAQSNIRIENNQILDYYYTGIRSFYSPEMLISNNKMKDRGNSTGGYGIELTYSDSSEISNNDIEMSYSTGIYAGYCYGNANTRGVSIFNNMIKFTDTVTTSNNYNGIYLTVCYYSLVAYNSVNMPKSNTSSYGLYTQSGSNNDILNNNFINKGNGYSIYIGTASGVSALNYNNLYSNGLNLGYYNGNRANLAAWKTATGKSANSINVDPQYVSYLNLHAQNSAIDGAGTPIAGITTDIDGQARSATAPDIGADEFTIYANDAGISSLNNLSVCVGSTPIQVTLRNYGTNTLTSTSIQWAVSTNGGGFVAQTSYSFAGSLGAGKDTVLTIGNFNFGSTGRYAVRVNTSGFNSGTDQNLLNDTTAVGGLSPKLSGTYTVGSSISDDWSTIDSAITALETIGVCGPTTILVRSGSYNEGVSFTRIPGASSTNTVTILGDHLGTGVDWYNGSTPLTIYDLSHVTFKNLNIRTTGYTIAIRLSEDNSYVTFDSNRIEGVNYNHTSQNYSVIYNDNSSLRQQHHITFIRNTIKYGTYSIYWLGYGTGSNLESNNRFIDNDIKEAYLHGIYTQNQDSLVISGNKIRLKANAGTGYGIYLNYDYHFKVHRNNIYMPNSGYGLYAVYAYGTAADSSEIFNNFITIGGNLGIRGIFLNYGNRIKVYHNSVRLSNSNSSSVAFYSTNSSAMLSYNNIFSNEGGGYAVYYNQVASVFSNYNNYYTSGSNLGIYSVNRATLSDWQTATGLDANSLSTLTSFTDTFDLHTSSSLLNNAGTPVGVLTDYDGDTRSLTNPDIGADEFNSLPRDLALLKITKSACEGSNPISVRIQNAGTTNITSGKIKWALGTNGGSMVAQTPFNLPSLATLKDTVVTLGSVTFAKGSYYRILIYVDSINGALDQNHLNDTLKIDTAYSAMNGNYTVGGTTPDFSSISNAVFALKQRGVCGPTTFSIRSGSYVDRIVLSDSIKGSSITNMITFRTDPASTSQAEIRSSQPVVSLLNGRYLNFENLHINHIGFNQSVWLQGISKHLRFEDNTITGANITSTATNYNTIAMTGGSTERSYDISFINNVISGGSNAMYFLTSNWGGMSNFTIEGNEIKNFCQYGIFFQYADSLNIKNNYIHASRVGSYSPQGISLNNLFGYSVSGNQIHLGNASTLNIYGIRLYYADGFAGDSAKVFNNMISIQCAGSNYKTGLDLYYSEYVDVAFNSINHYGYGSNNAPIYISGGNYQRLRNNIFSNQAGNWALYTNRNLEVSDYNNFYSNGANLTYYNGNRSTLAAWRTYTGDDLNSISTTPGFVNDSNLHSSSSIINGAATPLSW